MINYKMKFCACVYMYMCVCVCTQGGGGIHNWPSSVPGCSSCISDFQGQVSDYTELNCSLWKHVLLKLLQQLDLTPRVGSTPSN